MGRTKGSAARYTLWAVGVFWLLGQARASEYSYGGHGVDPTIVPVPGDAIIPDTAVSEGISYHDGCAGYWDQACCGTHNYWIVGTEATFLHVDFDELGAPNGIGGSTFSPSLADLDNMYGGPRVWAGIQGECWALVWRYWELNGSENYFDPAIEVPSFFTTTVLAEQRFDLYAADLEVVRTCQFFDLKHQFSFGVRHAALQQDAALVVSQVMNGDFLSGLVAEFQDFEGTGFTTAWGGSHPFLFSDYFDFYWNFRSSVVWGETRNAVQTQASVISLLGSGTTTGGLATEKDDELFIGEIQLGLQWKFRLPRTPALAFVRVAGEYQYWTVDALTTESSSAAGIVGNSEITAAANVDDLRVNLFGVTAGAGLTW
jgi:hypothetical protein